MIGPQADGGVHCDLLALSARAPRPSRGASARLRRTSGCAGKIMRRIGGGIAKSWFDGA
jgi:hypothetical protein